MDLSFSQAAASKLQALKEGVVIAAYYSGEPAAGAEEHADQIGMIDLGEDRTERDGEPAVVAIPGKGDIETRLHWVKDGEPLVNINVHSARRSGPDNLLDCDVYDGPLKAIAGTRHQDRLQADRGVDRPQEPPLDRHSGADNACAADEKL